MKFDVMQKLRRFLIYFSLIALAICFHDFVD